jgi:hypothetical protein
MLGDKLSAAITADSFTTIFLGRRDLRDLL